MPLLLTFHGMENENPYTHIRDFEEVFTTFKEGAFDMDLLKLKAFPLTLKDKAKIWLNSLRPRTFRNWAELQAEFLKKFFNAHKTNNLKRKIYTFAAHDSERFYQCWERYLETINACPHHGFDTWMLVNHFYDGMSPSMKQLLETLCVCVCGGGGGGGGGGTSSTKIQMNPWISSTRLLRPPKLGMNQTLGKLTNIGP